MAALGYAEVEPVPVPQAWIDLFADGPLLSADVAAQSPDSQARLGDPAEEDEDATDSDSASRHGHLAVRPSATRASRWLAAAALGSVLPLAALPLAGPSAAAPPTCDDGSSPYISEPSADHEALGVPQTWRLAQGDGVTVAVVDSGVDADNEHLRTAVKGGTSLVGGDPTGRTDRYGLGTAIAGVIAARQVPGSGMVGVAPKATILPVRVYQQVPSSPEEQVPDPPSALEVSEGIRWAADEGAEVINVSWSTPPDDPNLRLLEAAVSHAHRKGSLVVSPRSGLTTGCRPGAAAVPRRRRARPGGRRHQRARRGRRVVGARAARRRRRAGQQRAGHVLRDRRLLRRHRPRRPGPGHGLRQRPGRAAGGALPRRGTGRDRLPDPGLGGAAPSLRA